MLGSSELQVKPLGPPADADPVFERCTNIKRHPHLATNIKDGGMSGDVTQLSTNVSDTRHSAVMSS